MRICTLSVALAVVLLAVPADAQDTPQQERPSAKTVSVAAKAQLKLAGFYAIGMGVPKDKIEAMKWLILARAAGWKMRAEGRAFIAKGMTRADISKARRRARRWTAEHSGK